MDQYIGKLLDNRYEILEAVGSGGMARVYKSRDHRLNRLVAVKILREDLAQDAEFRRRFHDESQAVAMLSHPNIVAIYDVSRASDLEYIVMELIDGITLKQYMQKKGSKLNWREALHFTIQIVKALGHAHSRGIIHRDIKPHNVMVLRDGSVKVADFGIARVAAGGHSTLTQEALGSVHYISPEQARGSHIDARSDLYSAGVVLYEMITGRLPFEGDTPISVAMQHISSIPLSPRELDPAIPEALEAITMKAMAPNPADRFLSADEMLLALEEFRKNPNMNFDYTPAELFPEDGLDKDRTQVIHTTASVRSRESVELREERDRELRRRRYDEEDERQPGMSPWTILVAVVAVIAFLMGVVYVFKSVVTGMFAPPESYSVPDVTGMVYEEIVSDSELLGRFTLTVGETVSDEAAVGTILSQEPRENSKVTGTETEITVTISGGKEEIVVPSLTNKEYTVAFVELQSMGLSAATPEYAYDEKVELGRVISFLPMEGTPVAPGTRIQMVVSKGPKPKTVTVLSLLNMTEEDAKNAIDTMNLERGEIKSVYSDEIAEGRVVYQYPVADSEVDEGTRVNLQISKGPDPATQEPEPKPDDEPEKPNTQPEQPETPEPVPEGVEIVTIELPDNLPDDKKEIHLVVMMDGKVLLDETYDTTMDIGVPVQVRGEWGAKKTITYFFNGILSGSADVEIKPRV